MSDAPTPPGADPAPSPPPLLDVLLVTGVALAMRLLAVRLGADPHPDELPLLARGVEDLAAARGAALAAAALAAGLATVAGARVAGRWAGLAAGLLLALAPRAIEAGTVAGPAAWLLLASSAATACLLAARAGGGWAARLGTAVFAALVLAPGLFGPIAPVALAAQPRAIDPALGSPLLAGLRALPGWVGAIPAGLAVVGALATVRRGETGALARTLVLAAFVALVGTLRRVGAADAGIAAAVPPVVLLAVAGLDALATRTGGATVAVRRLGAVAVVAIAALGGGLLVAARFAATPADRAVAWVAANVPPGAAVLVEENALPPAVVRALRAGAPPPPFAAGAVLHVVQLPPDGVTRPAARAIFRDPMLAGFFPWMVLVDPPPPPDARSRRAASDPAARNLALIRAAFDRFFGREWAEVARFEPGLSRAPGVTVLRRPEGWRLDRESIATDFATLAGEELTEVREESVAFSDWTLEAGTALRAAGEVDGARAFLELAVTRLPDSAEALFQRALVRLLDDRTDDARLDLLTALTRDERHGGVHFNLGTILEGDGDPVGAEIEYTAAIQWLDDPAPARARLGALLARQQRFDEAAAQLRELRRTAAGSPAERFLSDLLEGPSSSP